jgi:transposase
MATRDVADKLARGEIGEPFETLSQAAQRMGLHEATLYRRLQRWIERGGALPPGSRVGRLHWLSSAQWDTVARLKKGGNHEAS